MSESGRIEGRLRPQRDDPEGNCVRRPGAWLHREVDPTCAARRSAVAQRAGFHISLSRRRCRDRAEPARDQELRPRPGFAREDRRRLDDKRVIRSALRRAFVVPRVNAVTNELAGERVDSFLWSEDPPNL